MDDGVITSNIINFNLAETALNKKDIGYFRVNVFLRYSDDGMVIRHISDEAQVRGS
jgi:Tfp pilus assembly ATPase PilU